MKKLILILAAVFALQAGNSIQAKNSTNKVKSAATSVSRNGEEKGETVKLTKEKFIKEIWDYEASPKEWKYKGKKPALIDDFGNCPFERGYKKDV